MPYLTLDEINSNPIYQPPKEWLTDLEICEYCNTNSATEYREPELSLCEESADQVDYIHGEGEYKTHPPLPYLNDINKISKWNETEFNGYVNMPFKTYVYFKKKCFKNKTLRCFKDFFTDQWGNSPLFRSFTELKVWHEKYYHDGTKPFYDPSIMKRSIHYNTESDILYIGGRKNCGWTAMKMEIE